MSRESGFRHGPLTGEDLNGANALVVEAGWNQVEADWHAFLSLGQAFAVRPAQSDEVIATACALPFAGGYGWISMVLVTQAWRRHGLASQLMTQCISALQQQNIVPVLDATPAGREVYRHLGFRDVWSLTRWRRQAGPPASSAPRAPHGRGQVRAMTTADWPAVLALDRNAFGCDRHALLALLRDRSTGFACVAEADGAVSGYLLGRNGRLATQVGPVVTETESDAFAMLDFASKRIGAAIVIDAVDAHAGWAQRLTALGFARERPFMRMALNQSTLPGNADALLAVAGPEFA